MNFRQLKDGGCNIEFSWRERFILFTKGKIHLQPEPFKHFINHFAKMIAHWQVSLPENVKDIMTDKDSKINGK